MDITLQGLDLKVVDDSGGRNVPILDVAVGAGKVVLTNWSAQQVWPALRRSSPGARAPARRRGANAPVRACVRAGGRRAALARRCT